MDNIEWHIEGTILHLQVDLTKDFGRSPSGKTIRIASSEGNFPIPGTEAIMGVNIYKSAKKK